LTKALKGDQEKEGEGPTVMARGNDLIHQRSTFAGGRKAGLETSPARSALRPRLGECILAGGRKLRLMSIQTLGETATTGRDVLTKSLHVALAGAAYPLCLRRHGLYPLLAPGREFGLVVP
jgi:hypothetical protein